MGAKKNRQTKDKKHEFTIKGHKHTHYRGKTRASFAPARGRSSLPCFNDDRLHYTPSFIVPCLYADKSVNDYYSSHQEKIQNNS